MKQQQYLRLFIAQDAEKDNLYDYSHLYLQQHVYHSITDRCTSCTYKYWPPLWGGGRQ